MKLTIKRTPFVKILTKVEDGIPSKTADPNYLNFLITLNEEEQTILSSDGAITLCADLKSEEETIVSYEKGCIEVPAKYLSDIIKQLEGEEVTLNQVENSVLNITDGISNFNINCIKGDEYPSLDKNFEAKNSCSLSGIDFSNLFNSTAFAVATKGPKKCFYGVKVDFSPNLITFVATDSFRLAQKKIEIVNDQTFSFTAPVKALSLVNKYCETKPVKVSSNGNLAKFEVDGLTIICSLYNGDFPSLDRIIPEITPYVLTVDSKSFLAALGRVTIVINSEKSPMVRLRCNETQSELFARSENVGNATETIKDAKFEGGSFEIGFNYNFVTDAIKALNSNTITIAFAGESRAFLVKNEDPKTIQLITPIRTSSN